MKKILFLTIATMLLVGCVDLHVEQTLHRDGSADTAITFAAAPDTLRGFETLQPNPVLQNQYTFTKTDGSVTYSFTNVPTSTKLFVIENSTNSSFFGVEDFIVTKKSGFPYTKYTYTTQFGGNLGPEAAKAKAALSFMKMKYTINTFGTITETNGEQIDDDTVVFVVDAAKNDPYSVTFKEWFFKSWFS